MKALKSILVKLAAFALLILLVITGYIIYINRSAEETQKLEARKKRQIWHDRISTELAPEDQKEWQDYSENHCDVLLRNIVEYSD